MRIWGWKMRNFTYWQNCTNFPTRGPQYDALVQMIDDNREITRRTFLMHADRESRQSLELGLSYELHPSRGMTMAADWHVSYHKSKFNGQTVYYIRYSAIEYIFIKRAA
jgi:hypothetical protein